jgi:hypothetical protein
MKYWIAFLILTILQSVVISISYAQKETYNWYFGRYAGLNFNGKTVKSLTNGKLNTIEGCTAISSNSGMLLFYTDGITIWNKNHEIMQNGAGLKGDASTTHRIGHILYEKN